MSPPVEPVPATAAGALHLTFDDGPDPAWTPRVLDALDAAGARATFFVLGDPARRHPELLRRAVEAGHAVGLHAERHVRHTELTPDELVADADAALGALAEAGVVPAWWRTPWGVLSAATPAVAEARGLRLVGWHADTHDWRGDAADAMLAAVRRDAPAGGVVLAHDGLGPGARRTGCAETVALIGLVAAWAAEAGLALEALPDDPDGGARAAVAPRPAAATANATR